MTSVFVLKIHYYIDYEQMSDNGGVFSSLEKAMDVATLHELRYKGAVACPGYSVEEHDLDSWSPYENHTGHVFSKNVANYNRSPSGKWSICKQREDGTWQQREI